MRTWMKTIRIVAAVSATGAITWLALSPRFKPEATAAVIIPSNVELTDALIRAGLGPEPLTAAGFEAADVETALTDVWSHIVQHENDLENADNALRTASETYHELLRLMQTRQATEQQEAEFTAAEAAYENALAQRQAALDAIFDAAVADFDQSPEAQLLSTIRSNQPWRTPWEFLVVDRQERVWVDLREALAAERYALKYEVEIDPAAAALLAQERQNPLVAAAITNLNENLSDVTLAWDDAVAPQE